MRKLVIASLMVLVATAAVAAPASERVFIAIADVETGRALVPEGTVVPAGVRFYVHRIEAADLEHVEKGELSTDAVAGQPLVFAYAPDADFAAARRVIAARRASGERPLPEFVASSEGQAKRDFSLRTDDTPTWYYLYFADGSYLGALRHRYDSGGTTSWGVSTMVYSAPGGYYQGNLSPRQTSNLVWGPSGGPYFDPYAYSKSCSMTSGAGGSCQTSLPYVQTTSAIVDSKGTITQRYGSCIQYPNQPPPEQPCIVAYSGTIRTTVPW